MEHLVKKSLEINPNLRDGRSTREVISSFKDEALAKSRRGDVASAGAVPARDTGLSEKRRSTIAFFLEQKAREFEAASADLAAREKLLLRERQELGKRTAEELEAFFTLMGGGADSADARAVLREFRSFLDALNLKDGDLLNRARNRR